jgi:hypothetical protein
MRTTGTQPRPDEAPVDVLTDRGSAVEVRYLDGDEVALRILTQGDVHPDAGADLLVRAVSHVRRGRTRVVRTAVDASGPSAGAMLDALRDRVGADVGEITLRRAGSSVMVTLHLLPARPARRVPPPVPGRDVRTGAPGSARTRPVAPRAPRPKESWT